MCFIGGGAGMAPMRSHIFDQFKRLHTRRKVTFWYGARSLREAFYVDEFDALQRGEPELRVAPRAVRAAARGQLDRARSASSTTCCTTGTSRTTRRPRTSSTTCAGPGPMNKAVIAMLLSLGVDRENIMLDDFG